MSKSRFIVVHKSSTSLFGIDTKVLVDTETGVNYLFCDYGIGGGGLTVLLDANGKPIVWTKEEIEKELSQK